MIQFKEEAEGILSIPIYSPHESQAITGHLRGMDNWTDAQVLEGVHQGGSLNVIRPEIRSAQMIALWPETAIHMDFAGKIKRMVCPLIKQVWRIDLMRHSEIQVVRYAPGGHYRPHSDGGFNIPDRYFTILCYLNDDFEGGYTWFPHFAYRAIPKAGNALLFPARYMHCAEPVITGEKFVMVAWILGPAPIRWI